MNELKSILADYKSLEDLKKMDIEELNLFAKEIRQLIIETVSNNGGHLSSNLGVVELTLALHKIFNTERDKIIWDVGHQSYTHKILTGRKDDFHTLRKYKGISGFPKRKESIHDAFDTGHSSTSISAGLGYALSRDIKKEDYSVVSVIGDGAMTAGMAFEALNHAGDIKSDLIVVLNDNEMSISENVGGLSRYLEGLRTTPTYFKVKEDVEYILNSIPAIGKRVLKTAGRAKDSVKYFLVPGMFFEDIGFKYFGPIDGHNISEIMNVLKMAKKVGGPVLVHVVTKKGKGYKPAEKHPDIFHGASSFDIETGESLKKNSKETYSDVLGNTLVELAEKDENIVAITAAMPSGTGLDSFRENFKDRFFDVGIAEQHGVTFAAGLAANGMKPFFAVYSTFLQRGYDQIIHDVCIQKLPVTFIIDRAGLVGDDGETHHGVFDLSYLSHMPNLIIMAPKDKSEFIEMIKFSSKLELPSAIRFPRGACINFIEEKCLPIEVGKSEVINHGEKIALISLGKMVEVSYKAIMELKEIGKNITLINGRFVKPLDEKLILDVAKSHQVIITLEDNAKIGGFGSLINNLLIKNNFKGKVINISIPDEFVEHGSVEKLYEELGMDKESIKNIILENLVDL
ncbi:1-deoxy-D-xylulose-5-phosphate synthase Dxs [Gottschalkia acidurici 9a]|uniref:1-deoxy-D-xylulose-5-phosphate synthase n=1 Tax=Gottschalkia acidurici (strain ATCC 7906 / DSM 604 / BCRC 14475 / CIP 104303 / KCTC 5404 / NCIMB 10678 / 9a) TaxID=1128398 RepID=K0B043_GOTA9|nr:1-deoxy-D-xylulose-5-phosphate synthase [Gottschalkia acidurici]AFS78397.1 1-deoxy-D-xylulose-5-phosphate synthase Dxs [Gottschalkia acidurici 9a]